MVVLNRNSFMSSRAAAANLASKAQGVDFVRPLLQNRKFQEDVAAAPAADRIRLVRGLLATLQLGWQTTDGATSPLYPMPIQWSYSQRLAEGAKQIRPALIHDLEHATNQDEITQQAETLWQDQLRVRPIAELAILRSPHLTKLLRQDSSRWTFEPRHKHTSESDCAISGWIFGEHNF